MKWTAKHCIIMWGSTKFQPSHSKSDPVPKSGYFESASKVSCRDFDTSNVYRFSATLTPSKGGLGLSLGIVPVGFNYV